MARGENDIIDGLYEAALGVEPWAEATQRLAGAFGGLTLMLSTHHQGSVEVVATLGMTPENLRLYSTQYAQHDLWAIGAVEQRLLGRAMLGSQVVEDRLLERSMIYNEFLRPKVNMHHLAGAIVPLHGGAHAVVGIHRPRDGRAFERRDTERLALIIPHLRRTLEIRQRLARATIESRTAAAVFDRFSFGVILLGAEAKLIHANTAAESMLGSSDGLIRSVDGVRAFRRDQDRLLQELIMGARRSHKRDGPNRPSGGHVAISRRSGRAAYVVMVAPVHLSDIFGTKNAAAVLLCVSDPDQGIVDDLDLLKQIFGFPRAEAQLVVALLTGVSPPEFARRAKLSYHTVRTLLGRAMARTETKSQLELVLLISKSLAGISLKSKSDM